MPATREGLVRPIALVTLSAAWIGAALLVAAVVAPAAFTTLPSPVLAGALVGRVLAAIFNSGCIAGVAIVVLDLAGPRLPGRTARITTSVIWVAACAVAQFVVTPRIEQLRAAAGGPIDALAADAPVRVAFGRLHGISVELFGLAMLAALVVLILAARGTRQAAR